MTTPAAPTVPIGPTTIVGYGGTVVGLIAAVLSMVFPDGDEQTIALIASSVFTLGSFLVTQIGRYMQAKELLKPSPVVVQASAPVLATSSGIGARVKTAPPVADPQRPKDPAVDLVGNQDLPQGYEEDPPPDDDSVVPDDPNSR